MKDNAEKGLEKENFSVSKSSAQAGAIDEISTIKTISYAINEMQNVTTKDYIKNSYYDKYDSKLAELTSSSVESDKVHIKKQPVTQYKNSINDNELSLPIENIEKIIEDSLKKYASQFQPQIFVRLDELFNKKSIDLEERNKVLENRIEKSEEKIIVSEKKVESEFQKFNNNMEESKASILGSIAIFSGIISYISVSVTLFDKIQNSFEMVTILISIMLSLICFLTFLIASLKKQINYSTYFIIISLSILAVSIVFANEFGVQIVRKYLYF